MQRKEVKLLEQIKGDNMIENYKNFLLNKLEKQITEIKKQINGEINIYSNFLDCELFCVIESPKQTFLMVLNSYKDVTFEIEQKITNYKRFTKRLCHNKWLIFDEK